MAEGRTRYAKRADDLHHEIVEETAEPYRAWCNECRGLRHHGTSEVWYTCAHCVSYELCESCYRIARFAHPHPLVALPVQQSTPETAHATPILGSTSARSSFAELSLAAAALHEASIPAVALPPAATPAARTCSGGGGGGGGGGDGTDGALQRPPLRKPSYERLELLEALWTHRMHSGKLRSVLDTDGPSLLRELRHMASSTKTADAQQAASLLTSAVANVAQRPHSATHTASPHASPYAPSQAWARAPSPYASLPPASAVPSAAAPATSAGSSAGSSAATAPASSSSAASTRGLLERLLDPASFSAHLAAAHASPYAVPTALGGFGGGGGGLGGGGGAGAARARSAPLKRPAAQGGKAPAERAAADRYAEQAHTKTIEHLGSLAGADLLDHEWQHISQAASVLCGFLGPKDGHYGGDGGGPRGGAGFGLGGGRPSSYGASPPAEPSSTRAGSATEVGEASAAATSAYNAAYKAALAAAAAPRQLAPLQHSSEFTYTPSALAPPTVMVRAAAVAKDAAEAAEGLRLVSEPPTSRFILHDLLPSAGADGADGGEEKAALLPRLSPSALLSSGI